MEKFSFIRFGKKDSFKNIMSVYNNNFEVMFDNHPDAVVQLDILGRVLYVNGSVERLYGYSKSEIQHDRTENFYEPDRKKREHYFQQALKGETQCFQAMVYHKNGQMIHVEITYTPILSNGLEVKSVFVIMKDISVYIDAEKKSQPMELHDCLTSLPNRIAFEQKVEELIKADCAFSILYVDIDRLRFINESLGQVIGDTLIKEFSVRIKTTLNQSSYAARISGDEFGVLLWDYSQRDFPEKIAGEIIESLKTPILIDEYELYVTSGIGISVYDEDGKTKEEIIRKAEIALHYAKDSGKNNYFMYASTLNTVTPRQLELEKELRNSIKNEELILHFQPRVDASSGKIVAAEALVRWKHPKRGLVSPGEFIPLAEEIGFINDIGDWVFNQVCIYLNKWKQAGLEIVPISINVTAQRFLKKDWKAKVLEVLEINAVNPDLIEFEITETTLIKHEEKVEDAIQFLKGLGIRVALDDFGTGYSSLTYVNKFSIDTLKIDRSFIKRATDTEEAAVIIKSLIYMAKGLKMNLVAEGVETYEQLTFLKQQECQEIQGYIFSKPVPEKSFRALLKRRYLNPQANIGKSEREERREYFRINLPFPLRSKMSIKAIGGKKVEIGSTEVLIEDVGPGGLRFLTTINLPVRPDILCNFEVIIMGKLYSINGNLIWKEDIKEIHRYGVQFVMDEIQRDRLIGDLNHFSLQLRNNPFVPQCDFIEEDRFSYLKKLIASSQRE